MKLKQIQEALTRQGLDGWLFFDHHHRDPIAYRVLDLPRDSSPTRRWYYLIPTAGEPTALVHRIEPHVLNKLPGRRRSYASWESQATALAEMLEGQRRIAMQYSPNCAIPYVSNVDAGTLELVRQTGVQVVSSADLVQQFEARWTPEQIASHYAARDLIDQLRAAAFDLIRQRHRDRSDISELEVQRFLLEQFRLKGLVTDHGPIVAINHNASDPHYEPSAERNQKIRPEDLVLIDMWAKRDQPGAVYYDITWTAYCGEIIPEEMAKVFQVVKSARDQGMRTVQQAQSERRQLQGFQVDDAVRSVIADSGYGDYFFHRTGHSIGEDVHGAGANMDNLETHDERSIINDTCFSVEPGIYLPEFGIRSEVNVLVTQDSACVTGEVQHELLRLV